MESEIVQTDLTETEVLITDSPSSTPGDDAVPPSTYALAVSVASLMALSTVTPNAMIITLVIVDRKLRKLSNYYIISLATADCIVGAVVMPGMASYSILGFWALGDIVCDLWITVDFMCCTASMLSLCMISLDRYWAITKPLKHMGRRSRKRALVYVASIWLVSAICWVPAIVAFRVVSGSFIEYDCVYLTHPIYVLISAVVIYYTPMGAMVYLYINVYCSVKGQFKSLEEFERPLSEKGEKTQGGHADDCLNNSSLSNATDLFTNVSELSLQELSTYTNKGFRASTQSLHGLQRESVVSLEGIETSGTDLGITRSDIDTGAPSDSSGMRSAQTGDVTLTSVSGTVPQSQGETTNAEKMRKLRLQKVQLKHAAINRRTARTLGIIVVLFLVCWLPFVVMFPIKAFCNNCILGKLYDASYWLAYLNSTLNPFLYGFSADFRRAFMRFFCKRCVAVAHDVSTTEDVKGNVNQIHKN
ncbi:5-hydroxytryptamine receptor 1B-like [Acanthaster planci]|uniref:5-hydroxytryptamine receptor 1B-like n=1 Tax=Acanthaster planci TaxID=133434 RepID=A0A8B7XXZ2_ACAPL|nr:5-hydroxytryptamine receptor 1B-like [Acanthaster planci]